VVAVESALEAVKRHPTVSLTEVIMFCNISGIIERRDPRLKIMMQKP
jgi:hypothetical protein